MKDIKKLREERGLSRSSLAEKSGLSPSLIGKLEKGQVQSPSLYTLIQLAEGLGVGIEYLLEDG